MEEASLPSFGKREGPCRQWQAILRIQQKTGLYFGLPDTYPLPQGVSKNLDKRPKILYDYRVMEESDLFD